MSSIGDLVAVPSYEEYVSTGGPIIWVPALVLDILVNGSYKVHVFYKDSLETIYPKETRPL